MQNVYVVHEQHAVHPCTRKQAVHTSRFVWMCVKFVAAIVADATRQRDDDDDDDDVDDSLAVISGVDVTRRNTQPEIPLQRDLHAIRVFNDLFESSSYRM